MNLTEVKYLTVEQAAELLHMHPDTVRRFLREKRLPGNKIGKSYLISQEDLDKFVRNQKEENK